MVARQESAVDQRQEFAPRHDPFHIPPETGREGWLFSRASNSVSICCFTVTFA